MQYMRQNPIPREGMWADVSGVTFLRQLLSMNVEEARFSNGRDSMYDCFVGCGVDPRNIAQRVMEARARAVRRVCRRRPFGIHPGRTTWYC